MVKILILIIGSFCFFSCGNTSNNNAEQKAYEIKKPIIPAVLASEREKAEYLALHFWDNFDFSDTTLLVHNDVIEQAFADYLGFVGAVPYDMVAKAINTVLGRAVSTPAMLDKFTELYEHYLYAPNSPARNEELYILVLEFIVNSDKVDEIDKLRPRSQLEMALKNRVGQKAADITIRMADSRKTLLYETEAENVILFVNNPDCNACAEVMAQIVNSQVLSPWLQSGLAKVFAVYPDKDITAWRNHLPQMPSAWINGYDELLEMRDKETYDLRAIPSLYLLDKDKKVLIKDAASVAPLEDYFYKKGLLVGYGK